MSLAAPVRATGALTIGASVPTAADTVTIGNTVYTWRATPTTTAAEVKIGADVTISATNLAAAINLGTGSGSLYGSLTVLNPLVSATSAAGVVTVTAKVAGTTSNAIATTESGTNTAWAQTTLTGGTGTPYATVQDILDTMQVNSQVITALQPLRSA